MKYANLIFYFTITILLNCNNGKTVTLNCKDVSGYYWRDYTDEIPSDAVPGGTDNTGKTTYIGQTVHPGASTLPGFIDAAKNMVFYEHGGAELSATEDVKILCSQQAENLQWVSVKNGEPTGKIRNEKKLVLGGHDASRPLAIGRTVSGGTILGKVLIVDKGFESLYIPKDGTGSSDQGPYEVLVYNPSTIATSTHDQNNCVKQTINININ